MPRRRRPGSTPPTGCRSAPSRRRCRAPPTSTRRTSIASATGSAGPSGSSRDGSSRWPSRATSSRSTSPASRSSSSATGAGEISAHYDVCRHRGSRLTTPDQRADPATGDGSSTRPTTRGQPRPPAGAPGPSGRFKGVIRCPYHSWCYELDGRVRNAPFLGESDCVRARGVRPVPRGGGHLGRLAVRQPVAGAGRGGLHAGGAAGRDPGAHRALPAGRPADRAPDRLRRPRQLEGHRRELQRVLPLLGRPPGAVPDRAGVPREGWRQPRLGRRRAAGRGHVHVHDDRPLGPRAVPGPRRRRAGPPQGRARRTRT